jgi:hypothetical protein
MFSFLRDRYGRFHKPGTPARPAPFGHVSHRARYNQLKVCHECGRNFQAARSTRKYCSWECKSRARTTRRKGAGTLTGLSESELRLAAQLAQNIPEAFELVQQVYLSEGVQAAKTAVEALRLTIEFTRARILTQYASHRHTGQ